MCCISLGTVLGLLPSVVVKVCSGNLAYKVKKRYEIAFSGAKSR